MKALSVRQPWAWLIVSGCKDIENRSWVTSFRGRIAIHASKKFSTWEWVRATMLIRFCRIEGPMELFSGGLPKKDELDFGAIVGTVEVVDCVTSSDSPWFAGPYGFALRKPFECKPIPAKGMLGLWEWPPPAGVDL